MASNTTLLLPGQSAPFEVISATDKSGIVVIATSLGLIFAFISLLIRLYLQIEIRHQIGRDDVTVLLAMLFFIAQSSAVFVGTSKGFGKTLTDIPTDNLISIQKAFYSSDILYLISTYLSKCSVIFLTFRLSPNKHHNLASYVVLVFSTLFVVISLFIVGFGCDTSQPWVFINTGYWANMFLRWQIVTAFDIIIELALLGVASYIVGALQLSRYKKSIVIFAFALRLPIIVAIVFRLHYLHFELSGSNPTLDGTLASVCTQIQLSYAIIAATTPCLRPFMSALSTNYGTPATFTSPAGTKKSGNSYSLSQLSRSEQSKGGQKSALNTRWDGTEHQTTVVAGDDISVGSHSSIQMIIQKNTEWEIEFEGRSRASTQHSPDPVHER